MEAIGAITNVATLIEMTVKIIDYTGKVKKGTKQRNQLHSEMVGVYKVLVGLKSELDRMDAGPDPSWFRAVEQLTRKDGDLQQLDQVLEEIVGKLDIKPSSSSVKTVQMLKWPMTSKEVDALIARVQRITSAIQLALSRANLQLSHNIYSDVKPVQEATKTTQLRELADWISPLRFREMQRQPQKQALIGTCKWFFESVQYIGWSECRAPSLWCRGIPGAGKTFIASAAFDHLHGLYRQQNRDTLIMVAFCTFDDKRTHSVEAVLASLLRQAIEGRTDMDDDVRKLHKKSLDQDSRMSLEDIKRAMRTELGRLERAFVIIDGLDEMPNEKQRSALLDVIEGLDPRLQLMVSSRPLLDIKDWFMGPTEEHRCRIQSINRLEDSWNDYPADVTLSDEDSQGGDLPENRDDDIDDSDGDDEDYVIPGCGSRTHQKLEGKEDQEEVERLVQQQQACYICPGCHNALCGPCYDKCDLCPRCQGEKTNYQYFWPQDMIVAAQPIDLGIYVEWRISESKTLERQFDRTAKAGNDVKQLIVQTVVDNSQQIFLLAKFHMDKLVELPTCREILDSLRDLPGDINRIYDDAFDRINKFSVAPQVQRLIQIVAYARKPLKTAALEHAIAIASGASVIDPLDLVDVWDLANKCLGLVTIDDRQYVRLSHETVGNYVQNRQTFQKHEDGEALMAKICLTYLRHSVPLKKVPEVKRYLESLGEQTNDSPLLAYAALHWGTHVRLAANPTLSPLAQEFLGDEQRVASAVQTMWYDGLESGTGWEADEGVSNLHLAAHFGLVNNASILLASGGDINAIDCFQSTALMYAIDAGHGDVVSLLLHAKADASRRCARGRTALHRACCNDDIRIVKQLVGLTGDIAINAVELGKPPWTALHWTVALGFEEILKTLLRRGDIDVNVATGDKGRYTPLYFAAEDGWSINMLRILLEHPRIQVNKPCLEGQTPLCVAALYDNVDAVTVLLDNGADIRCSPDSQFSLQRAIDCGSYASVRILVEHGADCTFLDRFNRGMLHACAASNRSQILRYLVQTKPSLDLNAQADRGETPLHDAARLGHSQVMQALLELGARPDLRDNEGRSPLRVARETNNLHVIPLLQGAIDKQRADAIKALHASAMPGIAIEQKLPRSYSLEQELPIQAAVRYLDELEFQSYVMDLGDSVTEVINRTDNDDGSTASAVAVTTGKLYALRQLVKYGADLNISDIYQRTPLHIAAQESKSEAAQILIDHGADTNLRNDWGETPLDISVYRLESDYEMARLLFKNGSKVSQETELPRLLRAAVDANDMEIVQTLCAQGVPCNIRQGRGKLTPCQVAKRKGFDTIAEFLIEEMKRRATIEGNFDATYDYQDEWAGAIAEETRQVHDVETPAPTEQAPAEEVTKGVEVEQLVSSKGQKKSIADVKFVGSVTSRECGLLAVILVLLMHIVLR